MNTDRLKLSTVRITPLLIISIHLLLYTNIIIKIYSLESFYFSEMHLPLQFIVRSSSVHKRISGRMTRCDHLSVVVVVVVGLKGN